ERNGMIGNIYSMGLALQVLGWGGCHSQLVPFPDLSGHLPPAPQALEATREFYAPREWDCVQAFSVVSSHDYEHPMAMAQVLPALVGSSYLDAAGLDYPTGRTLLPCSPWGVPPCPSPPTASIAVQYSITNKLQGKHFHYSTWVTVPGGSTLLRVLEVAQEENPQIFSFQTEQTSWGPMVVSIHGLAANDDDRTYWQFLSSGNALEQGVGTYKPKDQEHIQAVFTTW
ncbi:IF factor, partial [Sapayoa aenigma]|nr:IF factor [Sapayoa aenigma]